MDANTIKHKYPWLNLLPINSTHYSLDTFSVFKYCTPAQYTNLQDYYYDEQKKQMISNYETSTVTAKDLLSAIQDMRDLLVQQDQELHELRIKVQYPALCQMGYPPPPPAPTPQNQIKPPPVPFPTAPPPDRKTICLDFD